MSADELGGSLTPPVSRRLLFAKGLMMNPFTAKMLRQADALREQATRSIHPRNWPNRKHREKLNTCRARGAKQKAINGLTAHLSRHPNDKQSETHLTWLSAPAQ